ncbi:hypothetical protein HYV64_03990 [Candidatus Shapirobacteria bacterium]|nr:hypothetical protein [Candidatus Shapirobacteria bacterium]
MTKLIVIVLVVIVLGGGVIARYMIRPEEVEMNQVNELVESGAMAVVEGSELRINVAKKISMVDITVKLSEGVIGGFETNKEVFNSELLNSVGEDGSLHLVLGIMKATNELPDGDILVGKLVNSDEPNGQIEVSGKVTVSSDGDSPPSEVEVGTGGVNDAGE